ncbi:MAG: hypothetical protein FWE12_03860 [Oscillospiraceae bacterium]|nr:hypothetical protein [Oscillospiraceae bacterium]
MVWRTWTLRFTRQNGEEHILRLSNQLPMGLFVTNLAGAMGEQYLRETIVSRYFDGPQGIYFPLRMQFPRYTWTVDYSRVLDAQTGLRLSSVTAQELVADWDFMVGVSIRAEGEEETERFLAMVRTLAEYLSVDRIGIGTAQFVTSEHPFGVIFDGFYDRATDTFEFQVWDGHVRVGELRIE